MLRRSLFVVGINIDIYGVNLDWGSFEQGFNSVALDEALVDKLIGIAKEKSSLDMVRTAKKFNIGG